MNNIGQNITVSDAHTPNAHHHNEPFYLSAEFWVGVSFVLVIIIIYKPLTNAIKNLITKRIERIKEEFKNAENLKLDAQKTYAEYERKLSNLDDEINKIISEENLVIEETKQQKLKELDSLLKQKQIELDAKLEIAFEKASKEINTQIKNKSMDILHSVIKNKLKKQDHTKLIDKSISHISKIDFNFDEGK